MSWFTRITFAVFFIYMSMTIKSFYDLFYPTECSIEKKTNCFYHIPNWHEQFTVKFRLLELYLSPFEIAFFFH